MKMGFLKCPICKGFRTSIFLEIFEVTLYNNTDLKLMKGVKQNEIDKIFETSDSIYSFRY